MSTRYQELKKENNNIIKYLTGRYQTLALTYVKKARKFGVNSEDTEIKIKTVLEEIRDYDEQHHNFDLTIKDENRYLEEKLKLISKGYNKSEKIKTIIGVIVIIAICVGWIGFTNYLGRPKAIEAPGNFRVTSCINGQITLAWNEVRDAEKYTIYYVDYNHNHSAIRTISSNSITFNLEIGKEYTFYLSTNATDIYTESEEISLKYTIK